MEVRRVMYAVAMAGLGTACGSSSPNPAQSQDPLVQGDCLVTDGGPNLECSTACACGFNGHCNGGVCVACGCDAGSIYTAAGVCSTHTCYGSPPLLA
ncbi:MAG TPA: hypothetical protein VH208_01245 [Myxococcaceae bacterium]|nr:hypothetical protein [Myxococcaceae bacterium]